MLPPERPVRGLHLAVLLKLDFVLAFYIRLVYCRYCSSRNPEYCGCNGSIPEGNPYIQPDEKGVKGRCACSYACHDFKRADTSTWSLFSNSTENVIPDGGTQCGQYRKVWMIDSQELRRVSRRYIVQRRVPSSRLGYVNLHLLLFGLSE